MLIEARQAPFWLPELSALNAKLRVSLASDTIALVPYCALKLTLTSSKMIKKVFDTMIVASTNIELLLWPINIYVFGSARSVLSHLKSLG